MRWYTSSRLRRYMTTRRALWWGMEVCGEVLSSIICMYCIKCKGIFSYPFSIITPLFYSLGGYGHSSLIQELSLDDWCFIQILMVPTAPNLQWQANSNSYILRHQHLIHIVETDMFPLPLQFLVSSLLFVYVYFYCRLCLCLIFLNNYDLYWYSDIEKKRSKRKIGTGLMCAVARITLYGT